MIISCAVKQIYTKPELRKRNSLWVVEYHPPRQSTRPFVCSVQVKGLLKYCLHCLLASWQGWSTRISRSQLVGTTISSEILISLWFCLEIFVVSSWVSSTALWSHAALGDQHWNRIWNVISRRGMRQRQATYVMLLGEKNMISVFPKCVSSKMDPRR